MYKNYIFDLYGTLIDIHTDESKPLLWAKMSELFGFVGAKYTAEALQKTSNEVLENETKRIKKKFPDITYIDIRMESVFAALLEKKGIEPDENFIRYTAKAFRAFSTEYIKLYDGVMDLLEALKKSDKRIYLLTNAQRCFTMPEIKLLGLEDKFDGIVISSDEYTCKPDIHFYQAILNRYQLVKAESIMIGNDSITDIKGAHDAGIDSLYIHSNISPDVEGELLSTYSVMDGDVKKIKNLILKP